MTQYENYPEREYAVESIKDIRETKKSRMYMQQIESKHEDLVDAKLEVFLDD